MIISCVFVVQYVINKNKDIVGGRRFMENFLIKECGLKDIEKIKYISEKTFFETFLYRKLLHIS